MHPWTSYSPLPPAPPAESPSSHTLLECPRCALLQRLLQPASFASSCKKSAGSTAQPLDRGKSPLSASDSRRHKSQCWPSMTAPPCTQNRSYLSPLFPSLWASAPEQTHPLKCPPERRFAPARLPHSGPLNTAKVAASSDRASLHHAPVRFLPAEDVSETRPRLDA